jgi:hypothetical protein
LIAQTAYEHAVDGFVQVGEPVEQVLMAALAGER